MSESIWDGAEIISVYTVEDAVADGSMIDATSAATLEAGYRIPVTFTRPAWRYSVEWTRGNGLQDEAGRLWDVLWMMKGAAKAAVASPGRRFAFDLYRVPNTTPSGRPSSSETAQRIRLEVVAQGFDMTRPCLTVLMVGES